MPGFPKLLQFMHVPLFLSCALSWHGTGSTSHGASAAQELTDMQSIRRRAPERGVDLAVSEVQPNAAAPLLRTEAARKEWLDNEIDSCSQVRFCLAPVPSSVTTLGFS